MTLPGDRAGEGEAMPGLEGRCPGLGSRATQGRCRGGRLGWGRGWRRLGTQAFALAAPLSGTPPPP